jgi:hypothetical protein
MPKSKCKNLPELKLTQLSLRSRMYKLHFAEVGKITLNRGAWSELAVSKKSEPRVGLGSARFSLIYTRLGSRLEGEEVVRDMKLCKLCGKYTNRGLGSDHYWMCDWCCDAKEYYTGS